MINPTSVDMVLNEDTEDLAFDRAGRLLYRTTGETEPWAVVRRAATPDNGYARMIRIGDSAEVYNQSYFTELPFYLSSSDLKDQDVQSQLVKAASQDGRLLITQFKGRRVDLNRYDYDLSYRLAGSEVSTSITGTI